MTLPPSSAEVLTKAIREFGLATVLLIAVGAWLYKVQTEMQERDSEREVFIRTEMMEMTEKTTKAVESNTEVVRTNTQALERVFGRQSEPPKLTETKP